MEKLRSRRARAGVGRAPADNAVTQVRAFRLVTPLQEVCAFRTWAALIPAYYFLDINNLYLTILDVMLPIINGVR